MHSPNTKVALWAALTALFVIAGAGRAHAETTLFGAGHIGSDGPSFLYWIDPATGRATPIGAGIGFDRVSGLEYDWTSGTLYGTGERTDGSDRHVLITIDPASGRVQLDHVPAQALRGVGAHPGGLDPRHAVLHEPGAGPWA